MTLKVFGIPAAFATFLGLPTIGVGSASASFHFASSRLYAEPRWGATLDNTSLQMAEKYATIAPSLEEEKIKTHEMESSERLGTAQARDRLLHVCR